MRWFRGNRGDLRPLRKVRPEGGSIFVPEGLAGPCGLGHTRVGKCLLTSVTDDSQGWQTLRKTRPRAHLWRGSKEKLLTTPLRPPSASRRWWTDLTVTHLSPSLSPAHCFSEPTPRRLLPPRRVAIWAWNGAPLEPQKRGRHSRFIG